MWLMAAASPGVESGGQGGAGVRFGAAGARAFHSFDHEDHGDIWFSAPGPRIDNLCDPCPRVRRERGGCHV